MHEAVGWEQLQSRAGGLGPVFRFGATIAGEMTGRAVHAIELNPAYVDVAVNRWQDFTGQEAVREADRGDLETAVEHGQ